jgi:hypothetical protein
MTQQAGSVREMSERFHVRAGWTPIDVACKENWLAVRSDGLSAITT